MNSSGSVDDRSCADLNRPQLVWADSGLFQSHSSSIGFLKHSAVISTVLSSLGQCRFSLGLLGGIRRSSSLSWIRRRWSSLGGFIVVGLDLPALVLLRWVGCLAIARRWGIFTDVGLGWVDSSSLAGVGPSLLALIRRELSSLG